jgi:hypothetical protein
VKLIELFEAKFGHDVHKITDVPYDDDASPEFIDWLETKRKADPDNSKIGPHEGKHLNLMLRGLKPAAVLDNDEYAAFEKHVQSGKLVLVKKVDKEWGDATENGVTSTYFITLPGEEWRGRQLAKIYQNSTAADHPDAKVGKLLGYSNSEIRHYLKKNETE